MCKGELRWDFIEGEQKMEIGNTFLHFYPYFPYKG